jgi:peroxin-16
MRMLLGESFPSFPLAEDRANTYYRPLLKGVSGRLADKPVIGLVGGLLEDYQYLWGNYYFASATL